MKTHVRAAAKTPAAHRRAAPLRLGIRYALPPPGPALGRDSLLRFAALALLALLAASASFLAFAYRVRRELARPA